MNAELPALGIILAAIQFLDAVLCVTPISERFTAYLNREFDRLQLSSRTRHAMPPVKAAAGAGLLVGLWAPIVGAVTTAALIAYFLVAIGAHFRAKDPANKYVNAIGMLVVTTVTLVLTYLPSL